MTYTDAERAEIMRALARSAAGASDQRPVYAAVHRELGGRPDRACLRRWWNALDPRERTRLVAAHGSSPAAGSAEPAGVDPSTWHTWAMRMLGVQEVTPDVELLAETR